MKKLFIVIETCTSSYSSNNRSYWLFESEKDAHTFAQVSAEQHLPEDESQRYSCERVEKVVYKTGWTSYQFTIGGEEEEQDFGSYQVGVLEDDVYGYEALPQENGLAFHDKEEYEYHHEELLKEYKAASKEPYEWEENITSEENGTHFHIWCTSYDHHFVIIDRSRTWGYSENGELFVRRNLSVMVKKLFEQIDINTKEMWESDLESTSTCVQMEGTKIPDLMQEIEELFLT